MDYFEICIPHIPEETREILVSLMAEAGFESFSENETELLAYVQAPLYDREQTLQLCRDLKVEFTEEHIPDQNWNTEWEKNFEPVVIAGKCSIRAPFHSPKPEFPYEIIIEPKMSFGTAHHETTAMMIEEMLEMDLKGKHLLDMGCGTGILAILADKMGTADVMAIDNDSWAFDNSSENIVKNNSSGITVKIGDVDAAGEEYDVILANINRNVLLQHIPEYSKKIRTGELLMSGFYEEDLEMIREAAALHSFRFDHSRMKNRWVAARFIK
ncbi:MAG: 50S ribosomal protein L11 methyltransferase [Bacteroidetes bacterium]|nr:50S ribosomal protein L11 methyltransferase [Bacteroidota bacterium]